MAPHAGDKKETHPCRLEFGLTWGTSENGVHVHQPCSDAFASKHYDQVAYLWVLFGQPCFIASDPTTLIQPPWEAPSKQSFPSVTTKSIPMYVNSGAYNCYESINGQGDL